MEALEGTPLPRTKCQSYGCRFRARFFVGGSAGWSGHHCGMHAHRVVETMLPQVAAGHGVIVLPYVKEAQDEIRRLIPLG